MSNKNQAYIDSDEWRLALDIEDGWRRELEVQIRGGPKARGIATYDTQGRLISSGKPPKAKRPKGYKAKKRKSRKQTRKSRQGNRRRK